MRVLVTGAAGFIGSHLTRLLLREGHDVLALVKPTTDLWRIKHLGRQVEYSYGLNSRLLSWRPELCFHLAWDGWIGPGHEDANMGSLSFGNELLRHVPCRAVLAGSSYQGLGLDTYGNCKQALALAGAYRAWENVAVARIFHLYGPQEAQRRLVPAVCLALLNGDEVKCTSGEQVRDYLHVEDVASALLAIGMDKGTGEYQIGSSLPIQLWRIPKILGALANREELVKLGALSCRDNEPPMLVAEPTRLLELGWRPRIQLGVGLESTLEWWRQWREAA